MPSKTSPKISGQAQITALQLNSQAQINHICFSRSSQLLTYSHLPLVPINFFKIKKNTDFSKQMKERGQSITSSCKGWERTRFPRTQTCIYSTSRTKTPSESRNGQGEEPKSPMKTLQETKLNGVKSHKQMQRKKMIKPKRIREGSSPESGARSWRSGHLLSWRLLCSPASLLLPSLLEEAVCLNPGFI